MQATRPLNRNDDFLYTIFVPARAHEAFPCFDQPDLKARWTLELDVPAGWETLANGAEVARSDVRRPTARDLRGDRADFDLSLRVCRGQVFGRAGRAQRPHVPHGAPGDRRAKGRAKPRRACSICTRRRWSGWSDTPASRTRSASSISSSCRRSSSAGWNIPAPSSTTRRG